jgi:hypothetical protein
MCSLQNVENLAQDHKLKLEARIKSQASDWLKWRLVAISANQMLEI